MKLASIALLFGSLVCYAQTPAAPQSAPAGPPRVELPGLNETLGVSVDRFFGHPEYNPVHLSHGTLQTRAILTEGDPYHPGAQGAVLEYHKDLDLAQLLPGSSTPLETYPDEYFFYITQGEGRLDDGKQMWDLREGVAFLAPPSVPHRIMNSTDKPLTMIMLRWTAGPDAKKALIVRDTHLLPWCEENAHWNNGSRCAFSAADGLIQSERVLIVNLPPWTVSQPHTHPVGFEEVWTKISPGMIPVLFGSDLREMTQYSAYRVPPNGKTDHSNINISKDKSEWWIYVARGPAPGANATRPQGVPRPFTNPNLSRDTTAATITGKPLR